MRDPANTQCQTDVVALCAKLDTLEHDVTPDDRRTLLLCGQQLLLDFKAAGHLLPSHDCTEWFKQHLREL